MSTIESMEDIGLDALIEAARNRKMSPEEREEQMIDFVYGNVPEGYRRSRETVRTNLGLDRPAAQKQ